MILPVSDKYRIKADVHNWIIQKRSGHRKNRKTGGKEPNWKDVGYYTSIQKAATGLYQYVVRTSSAETLKQVLDESEITLALITTALEMEFETIKGRASCGQCWHKKNKTEKLGE